MYDRARRYIKGISRGVPFSHKKAEARASVLY